MKKLIAGTVVCTIVLVGGVFGTQSVFATESYSEAQNGVVEPQVNWSGNAYLTTAAYSNVTSSNNVFNDRPTVTNDSGNLGTITVKIVNSSGEQIGGTKTISKGKSVKLDSIPWNSGTYTLKAKASSKNGTYRISID